ncbi:DUF4347 domain-containing protein, partial [Pelomonas sp. KK5]|uniref:DUF4347 domain-containing protein n=1 Tax=Pelomonas sp. KK5 TaxID=1855730 RepID=UPI00117F721F
MKKLLAGLTRVFSGAFKPTPMPRRGLQLRALEPRVLLDAAAAATAAKAVDDAHQQVAEHAQDDSTHDTLLKALAAAEASPAPQLNLVFIDSSVEDPQALVAAIGNTAEVHMIAAGEDGVQAIAAALAGRRGIDSIHIISHGVEGALQLGNTALDAETMSGRYADVLQGLRASLAPEADILIYGCDFGGGAAGEQAATLLAALTGADVAASIDATGAASLGGDWDLELHEGSIEAQAISAPDYDHLLAAPVLDATPVLTLTSNEDAAAPTGAVGQLISDFTSGISGATNKGIAITGTSVTNGTLYYSTDNGAHWTAVGSPSATASLLLADDGQTRLYFQPTTANFNGSAGISGLTIRAWDRSTGTNGGTASTSSNGGSTPFSSVTDTIAVTVNSVNDAPSGADKTITINEDNVYNFAITDFGFSDTSDNPANTLQSVIITQIPPTGRGLLTYVNVSGKRVEVFANTTLTAAQAATLRWEPGYDVSSNSAYSSIMFKVVDNGGTANGGLDTDPTARTITFNLTPVNDAPVLAQGGNIVTDGSFENGSTAWSGNSGVDRNVSWSSYAVSAIDGLTVAEVEGTALSPTSTAAYIQQTLVTEVGKTYTYTVKVHTRTSGNVGDKGFLSVYDAANMSTALVTGSTFTAADNWTLQTVSFTATSTSTVIRITSAGSTSGSFPAAGDGQGLLVDDVQVVASSNATSYTENATPALVAAATQISDVDSTTMASASVTLSSQQTGDRLVVGGSSAASGTLPSGISWTRTDTQVSFSGVYSVASYQAALQLVGFESTSDAPNTSTTRSVSITINDGSVASNTVTTTITVAAVNDAPNLTAGNRALDAIYEDLNASAAAPSPVGAVGTAVSSFIGTTLDPDTNAAALGVAITAADGANGTWWYSTNNGTTWTALGSVSDASALLLLTGSGATAGRLYFQPKADYNGTATITIRAWDQTSGSVGNKADTTVNGGTTAFSSASSTATLTIYAVADTVTDSITTPEDTAKSFNPITGTSGASADNFEGTSPKITAINGQPISPSSAPLVVGHGTVTLGADNQTLTYTPNADYNGSDSFTYTVTSGGANENGTVNMTISSVLDAPRIDLDSSTPLATSANSTVAYDQGGVALGPNISVSDPEGDTIDTMTVTLSGATAADTLSLAQTVTGITASYNAGTGVLTLSGTASLASYQTALQAVRFASTSGSTAARTITVAAMSSNAPKASNSAVATITPLDTDGDGIANALDIDDDNDGILDTSEGLAGSQTELVVNSELDSSVGWTSNSGWEAWPGGVELEGSVNSPTSTPSYIEQTINTVAGAAYSFTVSMYARSGTPYTENAALMINGQQVGVISSSTPSTSSGSVAPDTVTITFYATGPTTTIRVQAMQSSAGHPMDAPGDGWGEILQLVSVKQLDVDTDKDGIVDRLDLDSDNDGITDNVEAQLTSAYKAPSGKGTAMTDTDHDGLDDRYDANTANTSSAASIGLIPVVTYGGGNADYVDTDSDGDGKLDITERGDGQPTSITSTTDTDHDGLLDIFEHGSASDGYDANDGQVTTSGSGLAKVTTGFNLADSDHDIATDGHDAQAPGMDLDYRDNFTGVAPPQAIADTVTVTEDTPLVVSAANGLLANDLQSRGASITAASYDSNGDGIADAALTLGVATTLTKNGVAQATLTLNADGSYTVTPAANVDVTLPLVSYTLSAPGGTSSATLTLKVTPVNDAPVLTHTALDLYAVMASNAAPTGTVGVLVKDLVGGITDVDTGALQGIAISGVDTSKGTLYVSTDNGTTWNTVPAVSDAAARLLMADANTRIYFKPNAGVTGDITSAVTFRAWDQTSGSANGTGNASANGGSTAFSAATDTIAAHVDNAPVLGATTVTINRTEDDPAPAGAVGYPISTYTTKVTDADAGAKKGIAITGTVETNGTWWYSLDGGTTWQLVGSVSATSALLLADNANTRLYFQPKADFSGNAGNAADNTTAALTFKAWDQTTGSAGTKVNPGTLTAYSSASGSVLVSVAPVNDAPVLVDTARTITTINEDLNASVAAPIPAGTAIGTAVNATSLHINDANVTDADTTTTPAFTAAKGIAITGADSSNGTWWYTIDGGTTWKQLGTVSDSSALLLANTASCKLYFQPNADFFGTATLTIRAWDQTGSTNASNGLKVDASTVGGSSPFSATTGTISAAVTAVADIVNDVVVVVEDTPKVFSPITGAGESSGADNFENSGRLITAVGGYAITAGGAAVPVTHGMVSLAADGITLTFTPDADYNTSTSFSFSYTVLSGGVTETASISMTITAVADAPRIDLDGTNPNTNYSTLYDQDPVALGRSISVSDPEGDNLVSMTITLANATAADLLSLTASVAGISSSYNAATGVLTLTTTAAATTGSTLAAFQQALQNVRFSTTADTTTARTISVVATSVASGGGLVSNAATATITPIDTDGDGIINAHDIDDDNDGITDAHEGLERGTLGSELISNPTFASLSNWSSNSNATLMSPGVELEGTALSPTSTPSSISQTIATVPGAAYQVTVSMYALFGGATSESVGIYADGVLIGTLTSNVDFDDHYTTPATTATVVFYAASSSTKITIQAMPSSAGHPYANPGDGQGEVITQVSVKQTDPDTDGDGIVDRLDLDSDDDGITDNVEAQTTAGYKAPSGQGAAMIDADRDGLDDRYDANTADASSAASIGLIPVNTHGGGTADYVDSDSDGDGKLDITERGDGQASSITSTADSDGDGLLDIFEHGSVVDGYKVNDGQVTATAAGVATAFNLADSDHDISADGRDAQPPGMDLDYR